MILFWVAYMNSLGVLCQKPEAFEISQMFVCMYITEFASILRPWNWGLLKVLFHALKSIQEKKNYHWKWKENTLKDHSTVDKVGYGKLIAEKSCFRVESQVFEKAKSFGKQLKKIYVFPWLEAIVELYGKIHSMFYCRFVENVEKSHCLLEIFDPGMALYFKVNLQVSSTNSAQSFLAPNLFKFSHTVIININNSR